MLKLGRIQHATDVNGSVLVDTPVLTRGDTSDRKILVEPTSLEGTGFIDWELANAAPTYLEYGITPLSGGHQPEWRTQLLEVLHKVLRKECEREIARRGQTFEIQTAEEKCEDLFTQTLAAWQALLDAKRAAQGNSDDCLWTFEDGTRTPIFEEANTETV